MTIRLMKTSSLPTYFITSHLCIRYRILRPARQCPFPDVQDETFYHYAQACWKDRITIPESCTMTLTGILPPHRRDMDLPKYRIVEGEEEDCGKGDEGE